MSKVTEECRAGAIRPDAGRIRQLRTEKGWSQLDFAGAVGCGRRTIENIENGKCCYVYTLSNLATALGVAVEMLCLDQPAAPTTEKRVEVQVILKIPYGDFDQSDQLTAIVAAIMAFLNGRVDLVKVGLGSTVVTLSMSPEDAKRLLEAMRPSFINWSYGDVPSGGIWEGGTNWSGSKSPSPEHDVTLSSPPHPLADLVDIILPDDPALDESVRGKSLSGLR